MQTVQILGIKLVDRTKWESLSVAETFLKNHAMQVILYVNNKELSLASEDRKMKDFIEQAGLTLWSTKELVQVAGLLNKKRHREVENREFLRELLGRLAKNHQAVMVVADTEEKAQVLKKELLDMQEKLSIVACHGIDASGEKMAQDVNYINSIAPKIVIARLNIASQCYWLEGAKHMISAGAWLAIPEEMAIDDKTMTTFENVRQKIKNLFFRKKVKKFNNH